jgi:hypothetical protein
MTSVNDECNELSFVLPALTSLQIQHKVIPLNARTAVLRKMDLLTQ